MKPTKWAMARARTSTRTRAHRGWRGPRRRGGITSRRPSGARPTQAQSRAPSPELHVHFHGGGPLGQGDLGLAEEPLPRGLEDRPPVDAHPGPAAPLEPERVLPRLRHPQLARPVEGEPADVELPQVTAHHVDRPRRRLAHHPAVVGHRRREAGRAPGHHREGQQAHGSREEQNEASPARGWPALAGEGRDYREPKGPGGEGEGPHVEERLRVDGAPAGDRERHEGDREGGAPTGGEGDHAAQDPDSNPGPC